MNDLERYLNAATKGLWGAKKREVREELEAHVRERAKHHQLLELTPERAIVRAIAELGEAQAINQGMKGVHVMPTILRSSFLLTMLFIAGFMVLTFGAAQVSAITTQTNTWGPFKTLYWLKLQDIQNTLKANGGKATLQGQEVLLEFPEKASVRVSAMYLSSATMQRGSDTFVSADAFLNSMRQSKLPTTLTGWPVTTVTVGKTAFVLKDVPASTLYANFFFMDNAQRGNSTALSPVLNGPSGWSFARWGNGDLLPNWRKHTIKVKAAPGTVYALISRDLQQAYSPAMLDFAPVSKEGTLEMHVPFEQLEFTSKADDLRALSDGGAVVPTPKNVPQALLVKFSGGINAADKNYEYVLPEQAMSTAEK